MKKTIHKFKNVNNGSYIFIEKDYVGYTLVQQNTNGTKQHLKLDDNGLTNFLNRTTNSVWQELPA